MNRSGEKHLVLAIAGDAGGAAALAPVISHIRAEGKMSVRAFAYREACAIWSKKLLQFEEIPNALTASQFSALIFNPIPSVLLAGTSVNGVDWEKVCFRNAKSRGIPTIAVLDFWSNYRARFSDESGVMDALPDQIAVMDSHAQNEMLTEGFASELITITGHPAHDDLHIKVQNFSLRNRTAFRESIGACNEDLVVLFASQPLSALYGSNTQNPRYLGYDEHVVLALLLRTLAQLTHHCSRRIILVIRPHPRESAKYDIQNAFVTVRVESTFDHHDAILSCDMVVGMSSALLLEATLMGRIALSLQPGLMKRDVLPSNANGTSIVVYRDEDALPTVSRFLLDNSAREAMIGRLRQHRSDGRASERVCGLLYNALRSQSTRKK